MQSANNTTLVQRAVSLTFIRVHGKSSKSQDLCAIICLGGTEFIVGKIHLSDVRLDCLIYLYVCYTVQTDSIGIYLHTLIV